MRRIGPGLVVLIVMVAALTALRAADAEVLGYRHGLPPVLQREVEYLGGRSLGPAEDKPDIKAQPQLVGTPTYFLIELGEEGNPPCIALFDPGANDGKGAVYVDLDGDGDLAEEKPLASERWDGADNFGPMAVKLRREGFKSLYHFWLQLRRYGGDIGDRWSVQPGCYNVGEVTLEGKKYRAATVDARANGLFNDVWIGDRLGGDRFYVDWNEDGKFASDESLYCSKVYWREGRWYRLSFSSDGTELAFRPGDFEFGTLVTGQEKFSLRLMSRTKAGFFKVGGVGGRVAVPADDYTVHYCSSERKDDAGNTWVAEGSGGAYPELTINAGQEAHFEFGPPFTASLVARSPGPYRASQTINFEAKLQGVEGRSYQFTRNGQRQPAPKMVIRNEAGTELGSYAFQYG